MQPGRTPLPIASPRPDGDGPEHPAGARVRSGDGVRCNGLFPLILLALLLGWWPAAGRSLAAPAGQATPMGAPIGVQGCSELVVNGGFETEGHWELFGGAVMPAYTTARAFAGNRSMRLGITEGPNVSVLNGVRQTVFLPHGAASIVLGFRYLPTHEPVPGQDDDLQYVDIIDANTNQKLARPWAGLVNESDWIFFQFDLTGLQGRLIRLEFGVINDGVGGRTAMFLDDVSVLACDVSGTPIPTPTPSPTGPTSPLPTPTPTVTPTGVTPTPSPTATLPTVTPLPTGCVDSGLVRNGGFEEDGAAVPGWIIGQDPWPPELVGEGHTGLRSLRLGRPPQPGHPDRRSYSSARQLITLPADAKTAWLTWFHRSHSQEPPKDPASRFEDRQEVILLTAGLETMRILYRSRQTDGVWRQERVDLTPFLGQSFYLYFNVFNDGNGQQTWMLLDDVAIELCFAVTPVPGTPVPETPTPTVTATPTATSMSSSGSETGVMGTGAVQGMLDTPTPPSVESVDEDTPPAVQAIETPSPTPIASPTPTPRPRRAIWTALSRGGQLLVLVGMLLVLILVIGLLWRRLRRKGQVR